MGEWLKSLLPMRLLSWNIRGLGSPVKSLARKTLGLFYSGNQVGR